MVSVVVSKVMVLGVGTLYPAYRSYKAVRTKNVREYVKWMMYWIVFALFLFVETFLDIFVAFWLPFYYEVKILFVLWLLTPYTKGASVLYRKFIHPTLNAHEEEIDLYLDQAKNSAGATLLQLGSKGVGYARDVVANAALAGQAGILAQVKKSYSLNDLSQEDDQRDGGGAQIHEIIEEEESDEGGEYIGYYENGELVERRVAKAKNADDEFEELGPEPQPLQLQPRRQGLRPRKNPQSSVEKYATLPRARSSTSSEVAGLRK